MKAILMAAGIGSRISSKISKHKSLLEVKNSSILRHSVEMLIAHNIEVSIVLGFKKESLIDELQGLDVKFLWNPFYRVTNSMASLWFAKDCIDEAEDLILANADVFWEKKILDIILDCKETTMLCDTSRIQEGDYFLKTENGKIVSYGKDLLLGERDCEYVGIAKIPKNKISIFKQRLNYLIEQDMYSLWWENVLYEYCKEEPIFVKDINGHFWAEVDNYEDYQRILDYMKREK